MIWVWLQKYLVPPPKVQRWLYGTLIAITPLLIWYGAAEKDEIALWIAVLSNMFGHGVAVANLPQKEHKNDHVN